MRNHDHDEPGRAQRERGVALIMVAIFGVGAIVLASTLLTISTMGITDSSERHTNKTLSAVVQAGIAAAVYEINHDLRNGPYDPEGDGVGAIGCAGAAAGVEVTVDGQNLGRYRASIEKDASDRLILTVVAAYPDFTTPQRTSAAQVILDRGTPPFLADRNALSIVGPAGQGNGSDFDISNGAKVYITDPTNTVPAVNIEDASAFGDTDADGVIDDNSSLGSKLVNNADTISGADKSNPGSGGSGEDSVSNNSGGLLTSADVTTIANNMIAYVNSQTGDASAQTLGAGITANGGTVSGDDYNASGGVTLPNGIYTVTNDMHLDGGTITGSGTLIIQTTGGGKLDFKNGTELNWTGDVIVIGNDSEIEINNGTRMNVTGNLAVVTLGDDEAEVEVKSGGRLNVTGTAMALNTGSDTQSSGDFSLDNGSRMNVDGLFLILGTEVKLLSESGSRLNVNGSMVMAVPNDIADDDDLEFDLKLKGGSENNFTFNNGNFESAVDGLGDFFKKSGADNVNPVSANGYWEAGGAAGLLAAQQARIGAGSALGFNQ